MDAQDVKLKLDENRIKEIVNAFLELEYQKFKREIEPIIPLLKNRGHTPRELFDVIIKKDGLENIINEIKLKLAGIESDMDRLSLKEKAFLASMFFIKTTYGISQIFASFIYEIARAGGLLNETNESYQKRYRAGIAREILDELVEKGILKKITTNENIRKFSPILKYLYEVANGKLSKYVYNSNEYKLLNQRKKLIENDERVKLLLHRYKKVIDILKQN